MQDIESDAVPQEPASDAGNGEFLVFTLGREEYGIPILTVRELRGYERVTALATAPDFVRGVINLRGAIVPVIDIRARFNLEIPAGGDFTVMAILNVGDSTIGMVVDGVSDVVVVNDGDIKPPPQMGTAVDTGYLVGMATVEERMIILMDIEKLMAGIGVKPLTSAA